MHFALHAPLFQLFCQQVAARVVPQGGADHGCGQIPLTQQAGNNGGIVKDEFTDLLDDRTSVVLGKLLDHHDDHRGEHAKTDVHRPGNIHF